MTRLFPCFLIAFSLAACRPENQNEWLFQIETASWLDENAPVAGVEVVLEEQRLNNGVLNAFYTEVDEGVTDNNGQLTLSTSRGNVLSIRLHLTKEGCFEEFVLFNPETLTTGSDGNVAKVGIMPACEVNATIHHANNPCMEDNLIHRWIPRDLPGTEENVRWSCGTDWQALEPGASTNQLCTITGDTWLAYQLIWTCQGADSVRLDSTWCPAGESLLLALE